WHVQFGQQGLKFESGKAYSVSFRAKANVGRSISVTVNQGHDSYASLGLAADAQLTNDWREFRFVFNASQNEDRARIMFGRFGEAGTVITLANVSVRPGGVEGLRASETIGSIPRFEKKSFGQRTAAAQRDWMRFLTETEDHYWQAM